MSKGISICVFRNDLRVQDNPILHAALIARRPMLPLYIWDPRQYDISKLNTKLESSFTPPKTWHFKIDRCLVPRMRFRVESVVDLKKNLKVHGSDLLIRYGLPEEVIPALCNHLADMGVHPVEVYMHREDGFEEAQTERSLSRSIPLFHLVDGGSTLVHPDDIPFKISQMPDVFTHFRKEVEGLADKMVGPPYLINESTRFPEFPLEATEFRQEQNNEILTTDLAELHAPLSNNSAVPLKGGETAARERVKHYFTESRAVERYKTTRNGLVGPDYSTKLSPFLAHGNISARQIYHLLKQYENQFMDGRSSKDTYWVVFELLWRDFWKYLVRKTGNQVFYLEGRDHNVKQRKWSTNKELFDKWKDGRTGVPFIDANMREIAATGYMSNRGRQNVASFLAKDLGLNWLLGAEYFEAILIDHDVCSNYGNWQYSAGVGNDPRQDRHFNIIKQAKDYDGRGEFVKLWVPELKDVAEKDVQSPWVTGGVNGYPEPVVKLEIWRRHESREMDGKKENLSERVNSGNRHGKGNTPRWSNHQ